MARDATRFSRVSTGYKDSVNTIGEAGHDLSFIDGAGTTLDLTTLTVTGVLTSAYTVALYASDVSVGGNSTIQSSQTIRGGLTVDSNATFSSNVTMGGGLTVRSNVTLQASNVTIGGGLTVRSNVTLQASDVTIGGGLTVRSNATFQASNVSIGGGLTVQSGLTSDTGISVGGGGRILAISTATAAVSLGAIAPLESSSVVTCALSGLTRGDAVFLTVDSIYNRAAGNTDVVWMASSSSTAGECNVWGVNSTLTAVTPTAATVIRLVRMNFATYV
jgi:hypothetical protein